MPIIKYTQSDLQDERAKVENRVYRLIFRFLKIRRHVNTKYIKYLIFFNLKRSLFELKMFFHPYLGPHIRVMELQLRLSTKVIKL